MAAEFSVNAVWQFLSDRGGKVPSAVLLEHFTVFLNNPNTRADARGLFKEFVNKVGLVVQEDGVKYVCLKKKYRHQINWSEVPADGKGHGRKDSDGAADGVENGDRQSGAIGSGSSAEGRKQSAGAEALTDPPKSVLSAPVGDGGYSVNSYDEKCNESQQTESVDQHSAEERRVARHSPINGTSAQVASSNGTPTVSNMNTEMKNHVQNEHNQATKLVSESSQLITELDETLVHQDFCDSVQKTKNGGDLLGSFYNPGDDRKSTLTWNLSESTAKQAPESEKIENLDSTEHDIKSKNESKMLIIPYCNFSPAQVRISPDINVRRSSRKRLQRSVAVNRSSSLCDDGSTIEISTNASSSTGESLLSTPRSSRKNFRELMISSSPQLRHSVAYSNSAAFLNIKQGDLGSDRNDSDSSLTSKLGDEDTGSVALDPLEHEWMLHASEGRWDSLKALLTTDPSLITWKDFVTGFTCLHWAAKHGKPELLAMLINYAAKHDIPININIRSSGGYTPLHLAAMHGHAEVVKLLSGAYDADVDIRDYSGKKAWQYLSQDTSEELRGLIGASRNTDSESTLQNESGRWRLSKVLPANLTHKLSSAPEEEAYTDGAITKPVSRKTSTNKIKFNRIRFKTQVIHSPPSLQGIGDQRDPKNALKLRPKSTIFG
ncbi:ankyrin repeat domain-containing protein SOWAHC [Rhincodon typus]|uniref:ankyrin repeat domain-containing protein SOWAHC n=1 Tax=Rhincodon typus TaxID=259920 RepID=UPI00202DEDED|nr:ankyrin repeat domain-containing protein SOWAHC [Rhincodon typus]